MQNNRPQNYKGSGCWVQRIVRPVRNLVLYKIASHLVSCLLAGSRKKYKSYQNSSTCHKVPEAQYRQQESYLDQTDQTHLALETPNKPCQKRHAPSSEKWEASASRGFVEWGQGRATESWPIKLRRLFQEISAKENAPLWCEDSQKPQYKVRAYDEGPNEPSSPTAGGGGGGAQPKGTNEK